MSCVYSDRETGAQLPTTQAIMQRLHGLALRPRSVCLPKFDSVLLLRLYGAARDCSPLVDLPAQLLETPSSQEDIAKQRIPPGPLYTQPRDVEDPAANAPLSGGERSWDLGGTFLEESCTCLIVVPG